MHYNLVKASNRRYLEELKNRGHEMKPVYDAVNIMQETEWVINKPVYEVISKLIESDDGMGNLSGAGGTGTLNYETGEININAYPNAEFVVSANTKAGFSGGASGSGIITLAARSCNQKSDTQIRIISLG